MKGFGRILAILKSLPYMRRGGITLFLRAIRINRPSYRGAVKCRGLEGEVRITRDGFGVPYISADTPQDVFFTWGFAHAQDRLWQMELLRRVAKGELAEIFGREALSSDRLMRKIGLLRTSKEQYTSLPKVIKHILEAYTSGVNACIDAIPWWRMPPEFLLLGIKPEPWTPLDSCAVAKFISFMLSPNWDTQIVRTGLIERLGPEIAAALEPEYTDPLFLNLPSEMRLGELGPQLLQEYSRIASYLPANAASNCWAVSGAKTKSGKPLLANDLHLPASFPSPLYEINIQSHTLRVSGVSIPGMPGVLSGRNENICWGISSGMANQQDLFAERFDRDHPDHYWADGRLAKAQSAEEHILVRGERKPVIEKVLITHHGPVITPIGEEKRYGFALKSPVLESLDQMVSAAKLMMAKSFEEFREALSLWASPSLTFVYADKKGNIGWQFAGYMPNRPTRSGLVPGRGWTPKDDWQGYIPFEQLPHGHNPPSFMAVAANNRPFDRSGLGISGEWADAYRLTLIRERLTAKSNFATQDFQNLQNDMYSLPGREMKDFLSRLSPKDPELMKALQDMKNWDLRVTADSREAAVFEVFAYKLYVNLFKEKLGNDIEYYLGKGLAETNPINALPYRSASNLIHLLRDFPEDWFAETPGDEKTSLQEVMELSLKEALEFLKKELGSDISKWQWGRIHTVTFAHPFTRIPIIGRFFKVGPHPIGGDINTIPQASYHPLRPFHAGASVPVWRHVADLADFEETSSVLPPGQCGYPASGNSRDQLPLWLSGRYKKLGFAKTPEAKNTLILEPNKKPDVSSTPPS